ncbi:MAG: hypothetical protein KBH30_09025, partial [Ferruginibacter sp.]|nr:hypothetical protein [Ferruginibacter sp.]
MALGLSMQKHDHLRVPVGKFIYNADKCDVTAQAEYQDDDPSFGKLVVDDEFKIKTPHEFIQMLSDAGVETLTIGGAGNVAIVNAKT